MRTTAAVWSAPAAGHRSTGRGSPRIAVRCSAASARRTQLAASASWRRSISSACDRLVHGPSTDHTHTTTQNNTSEVHCSSSVALVARGIEPAPRRAHATREESHGNGEGARERRRRDNARRRPFIERARRAPHLFAREFEPALTQLLLEKYDRHRAVVLHWRRLARLWRRWRRRRGGGVRGGRCGRAAFLRCWRRRGSGARGGRCSGGAFLRALHAAASVSLHRRRRRGRRRRSGISDGALHSRRRSSGLDGRSPRGNPRLHLGAVAAWARAIRRHDNVGAARAVRRRRAAERRRRSKGHDCGGQHQHQYHRGSHHSG